MRPTLKTVAMAIEAIVHDMTAMHLTKMVDLPEDDVAFLGGSNEVVIVHLPLPVW